MTIFLVEIVDPYTSDLLADGERGELVVTTLTKDAMPLIRYKTGDITSIQSRECSCGRTSIQIEPILARTDDMLVINGINVYPSQIEHTLSCINELSLNYKLIADKKGSLDVLEVVVELRDNIDMDSHYLFKKTVNMLSESILIKCKLTLLKPNSLKFDTIKAKRVVDNRNKL